MGTNTVLHYQSPLRSSISISVSEIALRRQNFPPKDIAIVRQTDGERRGISSTCKSRISALGHGEHFASSDSKSSKSQEEIISIIRRNQSSIEKESVKLKKRSSDSKSSDENASSLESVLEFLLHSRSTGKPAKASTEGNKTTLPKRRDSLRKEPRAGLLTPRPLSNFVRKSKENREDETSTTKKK